MARDNLRRERQGFQMMRSKVGLAMLGACVVLTAVLQASDRIGVYAVVEKVTLEPSDAAPQRVQVWGAFSFADTKDGSAYGPAQRGYLYYTCPAGKESICRKEWADMKSVAGTGTGIGFGFRYADTGRVRKADEKATSPDPYPIERGAVKVENAADRGSETMKVIDGLRAAVKQR
jgi:hypothetical protein